MWFFPITCRFFGANAPGLPASFSLLLAWSKSNKRSRTHQRWFLLRKTAVALSASCFYRGSDKLYFSIPSLHNWTLHPFYLICDTHDRNSARWKSWARWRVAPHITGDGFDLLILFLFSFKFQSWILFFYSIFLCAIISAVKKGQVYPICRKPADFLLRSCR